MNMLISSLSSPGYNLKWEKRFVVFGVSLSAFISLGFFASLLKEISRLYYVDGGTRYLSQNAVCSSFSDIVGGFFYGFTVTALTSLFFIAVRRIYLDQNSKSIYTVKRLPHRLPVFKLTVPVPLLYFFTVLLVKYFLIFIYLIIYLLAVPDEAIPLNWLNGFWRL